MKEQKDIMLFCDEWCSECEEVLIDIPVDKTSICPSCGNIVFPCSACDLALDGVCDWNMKTESCSRFEKKNIKTRKVVFYTNGKEETRLFSELDSNETINEAFSSWLEDNTNCGWYDYIEE